MDAPRDANRVTSLLGISSVDGTTPVVIYVNPTSHRILATLDVSDITAINGLTNAQLVDAAHKGILTLGSDGTNYRSLTTDAAGHLQVDVLSAANAGTFAVQADSVVPGVGAANLGKTEDAAHTTGDTGVFILGVRNDSDASFVTTDLDYSPISIDDSGRIKAKVMGYVAHDTADAGNPVKVGAKAITALSGATMVAAADRTDLYADEDGVLITKPLATNNDILSERLSNTDGASTASIVFGATANAYNMITTIVVHNAHATTNGYVDIRDGTAGTILMTIPLPANGGAVVPLTVPLRTSVNTALAFDVSAAITTVFLSFVGYKSRA